jgi:hypothetical protein
MALLRRYVIALLQVLLTTGSKALRCSESCLCTHVFIMRVSQGTHTHTLTHTPHTHIHAT